MFSIIWHTVNYYYNIYYRFYCTLIAAKQILTKMIVICSNEEDDIKMLYSSINLYLYALNAYAAVAGSDANRIISDFMTDLQAFLIGWLQRPTIGFGDRFGGKSNKKIRDEIKVLSI